MDRLKFSLHRIEFIEIEMPLVHPFRTSFGSETHTQAIIVKITDNEGNIGWGETAVSDNPGYCYETVKTAWHIQNDFLFPIMKSYHEENEIINIPELLGKWSTVRGHEFAKGGIEAALWALKSEQDNKSLGVIYGASKSEIPTGVSIGIQDTIPQLIGRIGTFLDQGYHRIKIKIEPGWDYEPIKAIRKEYGDIQLMVDANSAYTLSTRDLEIMKSLDKFELTMIEQPLAYNDILRHQELQAELNTPICLDESIHNPDDAKLALEMDCCRIINIKPGRVGGYWNALQIAKDAGPGKVWCGGMLETGIGRIHNLFLQANDNFIIPGDTSGSNRYYAKDIIDPEVKVNSRGYIAVPEEKGLGFNVREDRIVDYSRQAISMKF
ncbi:MAG: o-succinylbenzoate synthase [Candidatus Heimdallarchaeota archaeon LC_2]|nr:MAG: o-succinylbenzoate synthase [Candidatus Heimdallarchaeota archaeon LC_2]